MPRNDPPVHPPVRGSRCRDWWSDDETESIRQQIADADERTAAIAAAWQREDRRGLRKRAVKRKAAQGITRSPRAS
jgi:hypothetical protein